MIHIGDALTILKTLPNQSVNCCVTSPPYWGLRDYGVDGQIGLERTPEEYVSQLVAVFAEVRRVLRDDGTLWLNLGDSYNAYNGNRGDSKGVQKNAHEIMPDPPGGYGLSCKTLKPKDLVGIPWRLAFALQADGWYLRQDIIWHKPNPMPESVTDRCTKAHEYIFMLAKRPRYYYDAEAIKEPAIYFDDDRKSRAAECHKSMPTGERNGIRPLYKDALSYDGKHSDKQRGHGRRHAGFNDRWDAMNKKGQCSSMRNKRSVWTVPTHGFKEAHFATFPEKLIVPCILAGCPEGGTVLDPFFGAGTVGVVAKKCNRKYIGIELNPKYAKMAQDRIDNIGDMLFSEATP